MDFIIPACIVAAAIIAVGFLTRRRHGDDHTSPHEEQALSLLQNHFNAGLSQTQQQIDSLRAGMSQSMGDLTRQLADSISRGSRSVDERLDSTHKVVGDIRQQLGLLKESSRQVLEIGKDIGKLENILKPPKLRGGLGELFLGELLAQILPASHYTLQHHFKGGETVDAVISLRLGLVPIDAKFPLDNFRRLVDAKEHEERKTARKAFVRDVKLHIDAISSKYIRMDENTFDFALMYIPAENVYYETIIKDDEFGGEMALFSYSLRKRVIPVSPNSFYAYLQTIILGLQGMRVEEKSREVLENLSRLQKEFDRFSDTFRLVGQHMRNSIKKYEEAEKRFGTVENKIAQIDGLARGVDSSEQLDAPPPLEVDNETPFLQG